MCAAVHIGWNILYAFTGTFVESNLAVCSKYTAESGTMKNPEILLFVSRFLIIVWNKLNRGTVFCQSLENAADRRRGTCAFYFKTETVVFFCKCIMLVFCHGAYLTYSSYVHGVVKE